MPPTLLQEELNAYDAKPASLAHAHEECLSLLRAAAGEGGAEVLAKLKAEAQAEAEAAAAAAALQKEKEAEDARCD